MRTSLLCSLFLVVVASGCGRAELASVPLPGEEPPVAEVPVHAAPAAPRVRLNSSFQASDGYRFSDGAVLTTTSSGGRCPVIEVRGSDGLLVEGEAARIELEAESGRFFTLRAPGGSVCVTDRRVSSLEEVDARDCTAWTLYAFLHLSFQPGENAMGTGVIVRTAPNQAFRLWIAESGFDAVAGTDYVIFDFDARPQPARCSTGEEQCAVRDDCCNSRHSCIAGRCAY